MRLLRVFLWSLAVFAVLSTALFLAIRRAPGQTYAARAAIVNPDQGKAGVYRSLAQLAYQAYAEKNDGEAAVLARILEKVWASESANLRASSPDVWQKINKSMDRFARPLIGASTGGRPQEDFEASAYQQYLADLSAAD